MKLIETSLKGAFVIENESLKDSRGIFARLFCQNSLKEITKRISIAQINYSLTIQKGVVRGLHFQYPPKSEIKMVRCLTGSVFDVIVDVRQNSPTFLYWYGETISAENMKMMYVPEGFAHGFQTLKENCIMLYLHTEFYSPLHEGALRYNDPKLGIRWPLAVTQLSDKDKNHPLLTPDFAGIVV